MPFAEYLEEHVLVQWDSDLLEFLMQVSVTEEFALPLAETITGNRQAGGPVEIAFAAVGSTVRLDTLQGEIQTAKEALPSFEKGEGYISDLEEIT